MNKRVAEILNYMPEHLRRMLSKTFEITGDVLQEVRIRNRLPLIISTQNGSFAVLPDGKISPAVGGAYIVEPSDIQRIFRAVCENSVYAFSEDIRQGFVTIRGGHRIGITGRAVMESGKIENFREISSINIRVAREVIGSANYIIEDVAKPGGIVNTLLVAPPMGGKTTVLRDLARQISDMGIKTAIADERGEIAALFRGVPQNNVGVQTDVIENAPKAEAAIMLLRTMSPQLIVTDEISTKADAESLLQCFGTGVSVVASTHGSSTEEVMRREFLKPLLGGMGFKQIILLKKEGSGLNTRILGEVMVIEP
ncbi:MAG: stage III sporulation protein AA [Clostridia bacterium]|nr:stage III sporulation protein AA [Clostridia bacterium]